MGSEPLSPSGSAHELMVQQGDRNLLYKKENFKQEIRKNKTNMTTWADSEGSGRGQGVQIPQENHKLQ